MNTMNTMNTMNILELSGEAWHNAIENIIDRLSRTSFCIITFANGWREAQQYAIDHELKFDLNGNIM